MKWLIDYYKNEDKRNEVVKQSNSYMNEHNMAIMNLPTGTGKSGIIYMDIANQLNKGGKRIFVISTPLLKLNEQFTNDMFEFLTNAGLIDNKNCSFGNFSSDENTKKGVIRGTDIECTDGKTVMINSKKNIKIIIACNKSINRLFDLFEYNKNYTTTIYFDESHTAKFSGEKIDNSTPDFVNDTNDNVVDNKINLQKFKNFLGKTDRFYFFSATPSENNNDVIKQFNGGNYQISPFQAIAEDLILPPDTYIVEKNGTKLDSIYSTVTNILNRGSESKRSILVTVSNTEELDNLRAKFIENSITVFSTCSKEGIMKNGDSLFLSIHEFKNEIKRCETDCVVLHIRQLIAGIDIDCLTDAIVYDYKTDTDDQITIQLIGRILRFADGEREMTKEDRKKQHGNVYFIDIDSNHQEIYEFMLAIYHSNIGNFYISNNDGSFSRSSDTIARNQIKKIEERKLEIKKMVLKYKNEVQEIRNDNYSDILKLEDMVAIGSDFSQLITNIDIKTKIYNLSTIKDLNSEKYAAEFDIICENI